MTEKLQKLVIVMPCYNEEEVLPQTFKVIGALLKKLIKAKKVSPQSKVCFINDGSKDKTWELIQKAVAKEKIFSGEIEDAKTVSSLLAYDAKYGRNE